MQIVINTCFGGFSLSKRAVKELGLRSRFDDIDRTDYRLIQLVEQGVADGPCAELTVAEIPDECTDYEITEYDGAEGVTYVLNGKLHHWSVWG